jgi:hypothetical protein
MTSKSVTSNRLYSPSVWRTCSQIDADVCHAAGLYLKFGWIITIIGVVGIDIEVSTH